MNNNLLNLNYKQELQTARLTLRWMNKADRDFIFTLRSDPRVVEHTGTPYLDLARADAHLQMIEEGIGQKHLSWTIFLTATNQPIGTICFWNFSVDQKTAELGYELLPDYWGQGYALEAIQALVDIGFKHYGFTDIVAYPRSANIASCRLLEKAGFKLVEETILEGSEAGYLTSVYKVSKL